MQAAAVAPRAGAWIETSVTTSRHSRHSVAPRAGAWIETLPEMDCWRSDAESRPARARGLKPLIAP